MAPVAGWQQNVLTFWFAELTPEDWFVRSDSVDAAINVRFAELHGQLAAQPTAELDTDLETARAAIIVLDQFPRNMFREDARAFATDAKALEIAKTIVGRGDNAGLTVDERLFVYLPYEHSEDLADQTESVTLFEALGHDRYLSFAKGHRDVIARFGRFPHRNAMLGRASTPEERAFIAEYGRGF